ncbi:hypothetical protein [Abyssicoccus albus]|uniref:Uncharacterized protein n=1 Tax=Abyssicoccus albus TaxID=1817405 RepID=A0A3N5BC33_9BACL|nr:hypothetical protein [Abyssicoccus albus]RPF55144.1 hypothetical protein EDD62_1468 [Abyssicoccus albus]
MSMAMMTLILIAFLFAIFGFGMFMMFTIGKFFETKESVIIDTPDEALEKKVFKDLVH